MHRFEDKLLRTKSEHFSSKSSSAMFSKSSEGLSMSVPGCLGAVPGYHDWPMSSLWRHFYCVVSFFEESIFVGGRVAFCEGKSVSIELYERFFSCIIQ